MCAGNFQSLISCMLFVINSSGLSETECSGLCKCSRLLVTDFHCFSVCSGLSEMDIYSCRFCSALSAMDCNDL